MTTTARPLRLVPDDHPQRGPGRRLPTPGDLTRALPLDPRQARTVRAGRLQTIEALTGADDRLLVVVGPCSLHDPAAALEYAHRLAALADQLSGDLLVVMRAFVDKPRTALGWAGMVRDPGLTGTADVASGLLLARSTLRSLLSAGMPVAVEWCDPLIAAYLQDLVSDATIGARTVETPILRQLAATLPMPIGMKNRLDGAILPAVNAIACATATQSTLGVDAAGDLVQVMTSGNTYTHLILRGGERGPNYDHDHVVAAADLLRARGLPDTVVVDAAHGNSGKDHHEQNRVIAQIADELRDPTYHVRGVMIESHLLSGRQNLDPQHPHQLTYGQSITDACIGWDDTRKALTSLAFAASVRRHRIRTRRTPPRPVHSAPRATSTEGSSTCVS
ncbi:3-deoxy-7-phosphoheptulonate synthase [Actinocatenispora rupis]|uniref:Phospho-2-dehydro-3-deoxyheptonate aldolase n=1 Tax=Actinocatenispora rupis TaxID=519421 RepID=A0A8J3JAI2_9ACTN|nr:phospho-2-dehydro-3-deoxyheptonate aldolase [Actinocatenispora rupis]